MGLRFRDGEFSEQRYLVTKCFGIYWVNYDVFFFFVWLDVLL